MVAGAMVACMEDRLEVSFTVVSTMSAALSEIKLQNGYSLVLIDVNSTEDFGFNEIERIIQHEGVDAVALIADSPQQKKLRDFLALNISGVILKSMSAKSVMNIIRFMLAGEHFFPPSLSGSDFVMEKRKIGQFSEAELEVLGLLAKGFSNRAIAESMKKPEATIKANIVSLFRKLEASNRTQAVVRARELRIT